MPGLSVSVRAKRRPTPAAQSTIRYLARGGVSRDLDRAVRRGTDKAEKHVDDAALAYLPKRGGFAAYMARRGEVHRTPISGGLRLTVDVKGTDAARINAGRLRHRVWGRDVWVTQTVRPGYADEALRRVKVDVDREIRRAMADPGGR